MIQVRYEFPLPNDGLGYKFTEKELIELLDRIYEKGRADERELQKIMLESVTTKSMVSKVSGYRGKRC